MRGKKLCSSLGVDAVQKLLQIVTSEDLNNAQLELPPLLSRKYDRPAIAECLSCFTRQQLLKLCDALLRHANAGFQHLDTTEGQSPCGQAWSSQDASSLLRISAALAAEILQLCPGNPPETLQQLAALLHGNALLAHSNCCELQDAVAKLCCNWWESQAPGKETLIARTLPYLLVRALVTGKACDVKQCLVMADALTLLDFDDASIADMKRLLLRAAFCPAFLHCCEGRRFLAGLFNLHPQLVRELTAIIRNQIPSGRRSLLDAYGEVLFRAWSRTTGACLYELETCCIQGLMQAAIVASSQALCGALRHVLRGLTMQKRIAGVDAMLLRLYQPILFRAFAAANPCVRRNALECLMDAFPLMNPDASAEDTDQLLSLQFKHIAACLTDPCPAVRISAIAATCNILNLYWEIIPAASTSKLMATLTGELAYDASSPAVRAAVLQGLELLVDNPHAQPLLKKVLPPLGALLADASLRVREVMAGLLAVIATSRGLTLMEVVPLDVLVDVMAHDSASVSQRVQQVLLPSFFPGAEEGAARVSALLRKHPVAGRAFCSYLVTGHLTEQAGGSAHVFCAKVPMEQILQLVHALLGHLLACLTKLAPDQGRPMSAEERVAKKNKTTTQQRATKGASQKSKAAGKRRKAGSAAALPQPAAEVNHGSDGEPQECATQVCEEALDADAWQAQLEGLGALCAGLAAAVEREACCEEDVQRCFTNTSLQQLLLAAPSASCRCAVLMMAESLPFLNASALLRRYLLQCMCGGVLPPDEPLPCSSSTAPGCTELGCVVSALAASANGAMLLAVVVKALESAGSEETGGEHHACLHSWLGVRGLSNGQLEDDDRPSDVADFRCSVCGKSEPENTLLLCDGCDVATHTTCLRPALPAVPDHHWFCKQCDKQISHACMSVDAACRCLSHLMLGVRGRELLHRTSLMERLMAGLEHATGMQCQAWAAALPLPGAASGSADHHSHALIPDDACRHSCLLIMCRLALHLAAITVAGVGGGGPAQADALEAQEAAQPALAAACQVLLQGSLMGVQLMQAAQASLGAVSTSSPWCMQQAPDLSQLAGCGGALLRMWVEAAQLHLIDACACEESLCCVVDLARHLQELASTCSWDREDLKERTQMSEWWLALLRASSMLLAAVQLPASKEHDNASAQATRDLVTRVLQHTMDAEQGSDAGGETTAVGSRGLAWWQHASPLSHAAATLLEATLQQNTQEANNTWLQRMAQVLGNQYLSSVGNACTVGSSTADDDRAGQEAGGSVENQDPNAAATNSQQHSHHTTGKKLRHKSNKQLKGMQAGPFTAGAVVELAAWLVYTAAAKKVNEQLADLVVHLAATSWRHKELHVCAGAMLLLEKLGTPPGGRHKRQGSSDGTLHCGLKHLTEEMSTSCEGGVEGCQELVAFRTLVTRIAKADK